MPAPRCARSRPRRARRCSGSGTATTPSGSTRCSSSTSGSSRAINALVAGGIRVVAAGLAQDFRGAPFGAMPTLLCLAEYVDKLEAVCHRCGGPATLTQRLLDGPPGAVRRRDRPDRGARFLRGALPRLLRARRRRRARRAGVVARAPTAGPAASRPLGRPCRRDARSPCRPRASRDRAATRRGGPAPASAVTGASVSSRPSTVQVASSTPPWRTARDRERFQRAAHRLDVGLDRLAAALDGDALVVRRGEVERVRIARAAARSGSPAIRAARPSRSIRSASWPPASSIIPRKRVARSSSSAAADERLREAAHGRER